MGHEPRMTEQSLYRVTLDLLGECVHVIDADFRFMVLNEEFKRWCRELGLEPEVAGHSIFEVFPFLPDRVREEYQAVFDTGEALVTEDKTAINGREFFTETRKSPVLEGEKVVAVITVIRDITARRHAEKALKESEEKYRSLVESTDDSIYVVDRDCRYLYMNSKHVARMGLSGDDYLGKTYGETHAPGETEVFVEILSEVLETMKSLQHEHKSHRDGKYFLRTLSPITGPDGKIIAVSIVSKDVTTMKQMEEEKEKLISELQDAFGKIKTLKGLIPVCAWCGKVRDDQGYWSELETYIKNHSDADFTHGICLECIKKVKESEEGL